MVDTVSRSKRSQTMAAIRSEHTQPELVVRRVLHRAGYRYRLHDKNIPGKPDLVLKKYRTAIFVHGCFWHAHGCKLAHLPKSNAEYWIPKIKRNLERDKKHLNDLIHQGWRVLIIWECAVRKTNRLPEQKLLADIKGFLIGKTPKAGIESKISNG